MSSAEAQRFAKIATDVIESVKQAGKFDSRMFELQLNAAEMTLGGEILRWIVGKEVKLTSSGDVYGRKWDVQTYESILDTVLTREYHKNLIYQAIKNGDTSVRAVSARVGLELKRISYLLADMEKTNKVTFKGMENRIPVFAAI